METYFVIRRLNSKPTSFQRQPSQYSSPAAMVYAISLTRKKHTGLYRVYCRKLVNERQFFFTASASVLGRGKSQNRQHESIKRKLINYSSMRITHKPPSIPVRRNTTRAQHRNLHARSQPNMRQLESVSNLNSTKSYKSIDRDTPTGNMPRLTVSQSAPHTPVSTGHPDHNFCKSVPRLLSEPIVGSCVKSNSPGVKSLQFIKSERSSPFFNDKKFDNNTDSNCDLDSNKSNKIFNTPVPVHSPKIINKRENKFFLKSPILKKDTKIQLDNPIKNDKMKSVKTDGTDV